MTNKIYIVIVLVILTFVGSTDVTCKPKNIRQHASTAQPSRIHHHHQSTNSPSNDSLASLHSFAAAEALRLRGLGRSEALIVMPVPEKTMTASPEPNVNEMAVSRIEENTGVDQQDVERELTDASKLNATQMFGRSVCIALTGVDSRLGVSQRHADANHVLRIWLDKGEIEIFSVPRGTHVDAGFKSEGLNYLANLRSNKGRDVYLKELARISGVGKIDYWVELGFSQAIGVIEMLGFRENAKTTLHVLRTRKAFAVGDYQRCYNQGQFIRQMIVNNFNKSTGFLGGVALRAALGLVETNLTYDVTRSIIEELEKHNFPKGSSVVSVRLRPPFNARLKELDLADAGAISQANTVLDKRLKKSGYIAADKAPAFNAGKYESRLAGRISRAERLTRTNPKAAVSALKVVYKQRSWIQVADKVKRNDYMKRICDALATGYEAQGFMIEADNVRYFYDQQVRGAEGLMGGNGR